MLKLCLRVEDFDFSLDFILDRGKVVLVSLEITSWESRLEGELEREGKLADRTVLSIKNDQRILVSKEFIFSWVFSPLFTRFGMNKKIKKKNKNMIDLI